MIETNLKKGMTLSSGSSGARLWTAADHERDCHSVYAV